VAQAVADRNFIIHQYDEINRDLTWLTLSRDLPTWRASLKPLFAEAASTVQEEPGRGRPVGSERQHMKRRLTLSHSA
jgi:hypothetical protein